MKKRNRINAKGRRESGHFIALPTRVITSSQYSMLCGWSVKLLIDLYAQYRGGNNGDFCAAWSMMEMKGWRSKGTLHRALKELIECGFIVQSRQGGRNKASLYAVTFQAIDDCGGKLDISSTAAPTSNWRNKKAEG